MEKITADNFWERFRYDSTITLSNGKKLTPEEMREVGDIINIQKGLASYEYVTEAEYGAGAANEGLTRLIDNLREQGHNEEQINLALCGIFSTITTDVEEIALGDQSGEIEIEAVKNCHYIEEVYKDLKGREAVEKEAGQPER